MKTLMRNVRYSIRTLARTPGFTVTVVLTLALGIGANSAVFSAIDAVLLQPLAFPNADRLVRVRQTSATDTTEMPVAPPRLEDWSRQSSAFESLSGFYVEDVSDTTGEFAERVRRAVVAPRFLEVLGVTPILGRGFAESEGEREAATAAVLISERYWRNRFGADPNVLDKQIQLENQLYSIAGVMPASFRFPNRNVDLWWRYPADGPLVQNTTENRQLAWYTGIGRLKPGVTLEQAQAELAAVQMQLGAQYPGTDAEIGVRIVSLKEVVVSGTRGSLWLLFGVVSVLLLIACTNIAALLLARAARREQEIAVRVSLGASRAAIVVQLLTETLVLAFAGAAVGLLVAAGAFAAFRTLAPELPRLEEAGIDGRILLYTTVSAAVVALLCGLLPAFKSARRAGSLSESSRTQVSTRHSLQWSLVGVQVALSVTLLAGAGLLLRSAEALLRVEPGFDPAAVLAFRVSGNWSENYDDPDRLVQRVDGTLDELGALPGVEAVATSWTVPGAPGASQIEFELVEGRSESEPPLIAAWRTVSPGYFDTMAIPLAAGELCRSLPAGIHRPGSALDLMVNRRFADSYFPGTSVVGLHLTWETGSLSGRIVGIVGNAREVGIDRDVAPTVYACDSAPNPFPWYLVRTSGAPPAMAGAIRLKLKELEPLRSVYDIAPLEQLIGGAYAQNRLRTYLIVFFAATALSLACLGIYGTLSYVVSLRRREIGLRVALGARQGNIVSQFLLKALRVVGLACVAGLALSLAFTRVLSGMLYGVSPSDPITLSGVVVIVMAVAALAALLPALRASRIDPMHVLREE